MFVLCAVYNVLCAETFIPFQLTTIRMSGASTIKCDVGGALDVSYFNAASATIDTYGLVFCVFCVVVCVVHCLCSCLISIDVGTALTNSLTLANNGTLDVLYGSQAHIGNGNPSSTFQFIAGTNSGFWQNDGDAYFNSSVSWNVHCVGTGTVTFAPNCHKTAGAESCAPSSGSSTGGGGSTGGGTGGSSSGGASTSSSTGLGAAPSVRPMFGGFCFILTALLVGLISLIL